MLITKQELSKKYKIVDVTDKSQIKLGLLMYRHGYIGTVNRIIKKYDQWWCDDGKRTSFQCIPDEQVFILLPKEPSGYSKLVKLQEEIILK